MNFLSVYANLDTAFPVSECVIPSPNLCDKGVFNSPESYLCLVLDRRFKDIASLRVMKPYVWNSVSAGGASVKDFGEFVCYGWSDDSGNFVDNFENPVHGTCEDEYVVGFSKYVVPEADAYLWSKLPQDE